MDGLVAPHQLQILPRAWRELGFQHGSVPRSGSYFSGYAAAILLQITHIEQFLKLSRSHAASEMSFLPIFFFPFIAFPAARRFRPLLQKGAASQAARREARNACCNCGTKS